MGVQLTACWGPKGGAGTTTVAVALAVLASRTASRGALLADLAGDAPAVAGRPEPSGPGLADWLAAPDDVSPAALEGLEMDAADGLGILPSGGEIAAPAGSDSGERRARVLLAALGAQAARGRPVIVDCGVPRSPVARAVARHAPVSLAVLRPCYLAVRRALAAPELPSGVVLVVDEGRSLSAADVADVLGVPVVAEVPVDPAVGRAVDAGVLPRRLPRSLARSLRALAGGEALLARPSEVEVRR